MTALPDDPVNERRHREHKPHKVLLAPPWEWQPHAACVGLPVEWFIPDDGHDLEQGREVCARCPVREHCAEHAIAYGEHGLWGGLTDEDRRKIRRKRKLTPPRRTTVGPPPHHSEARAAWDHRRGLPRCDGCSKAATVAREARQHLREQMQDSAQMKPAPTPGEKKCNICGQTKPVAEFNRRRSSRDGYQHKCRTCQRERYREWYANNLQGSGIKRARCEP